MTEILLLNMPFVSISRPAIGVSTLKSVLMAHGIKVRVAYANILFAQMIGMKAYELLDEKLNDALFAGDWLFAQYLFTPDLDLDTYIHTLRHHLDDEKTFEKVMAVRGRIEEFLHACIDKYRIREYRAIGFSTTFEQNLASLALAKVIKKIYPDKKIIFGGANCEGSMGYQLHKSFSWIDYICTGEGERCLPDLIHRMNEDHGVENIKGIIYRDAGQSIDNGHAESVTDLDSIPIPDYDDYFNELSESGLRESLNPSLLIETSRGCWWGAKSHCTFCGLNGATMGFRSKSTPRVLHELQYLKERHSIHQFVAVDNIIDMRYFQGVLPKLREKPLGVSLFYETKANLKKEQVALLRDAGIMAIQPGIESLSSHVLHLMRKGVTGIQNMQLLKWCKQFGVSVAWNLLYGFPGETKQDYEDVSAYMDALYHLQPPHSMGPVRMDRFSPYFTEPESFGLTNVRPFSIYQFIYPLSPEELRHLIYFFEFDYMEERENDTYVDEVREKIAEWRASDGCYLYKSYGDDAELLITDTRPNRTHDRIVLSGIQREVYDFCDQKRSLSGITRFLNQTYVVHADLETWLLRFLQQMVEWRLMVCEGEQYLSLAITEYTTTK